MNRIIAPAILFVAMTLAGSAMALPQNHLVTKPAPVSTTVNQDFGVSYFVAQSSNAN